MLAREAAERGFELRAGDIYCSAATLAEPVVMVWGEYLAELDLVLKPVPDAVNNAEFFVEFDGAVHGCAVHLGREPLCKGANADWSARKLRKHLQPGFCGAVPGGFECRFKFCGRCFHCL